MPPSSLCGMGCFSCPRYVFLINSWIGLTAPLVMYIFLRILVRKEEEYLEQKFGEEYIAYKKMTPAVLPLGRMIRK